MSKENKSIDSRKLVIDKNSEIMGRINTALSGIRKDAVGLIIFIYAFIGLIVTGIFTVFTLMILGLPFLLFRWITDNLLGRVIEKINEALKHFTDVLETKK